MGIGLEILTYVWQATEPETVIALAGLLAQHTPVRLGAQVVTR